MRESNLQRQATAFRVRDTAPQYQPPFRAAAVRAPHVQVDDAEGRLDRAFLEGNSPIDLGRLALTTEQQAKEFLRSYGYDLDNEEERTAAYSMYREAVQFLQHNLCPAPRACDQTLIMAEEVARCRKLTDLLLWASRPGEDRLQAWSCAVLRVMHTISHANHASVSPYSDEIRRQILGRYRRHVHEREAGLFSLGLGPESVPLTGIRFREEKSRQSIILKLLHKPDNLPQSIFDRVGVRMVTPTAQDALRALKYIRKHHLANFAHVMPGRSRNTLIPQEIVPGTATPTNPYSSPSFRSIQFTCQQLVKVPNPLYGLVQHIQSKPGQAELAAALSWIPGHSQEPYLRFFVPYEVQILDEENNHKTEFGESSHANYRLRQVRAVRARILGALLRQLRATREN